MFCTNVPDATAWVAKAERDLLNIANNVAADETPWDTVCFHAQQAAEKLLKGFLMTEASFHLTSTTSSRFSRGARAGAGRPRVRLPFPDRLRRRVSLPG